MALYKCFFIYYKLAIKQSEEPFALLKLNDPYPAGTVYIRFQANFRANKFN